MGLVGFPASLGRYLSGLCVATLGLCAAGWLALAPAAFGYQSDGRPGMALHSAGLPSAGLPSAGLPSVGLHSAGLHRAALTDWATAAGLAVVSLVTLVSWVVAWRRKLRADGILARTSRRQARREARAQRRREHDGEAAASTPDPAQVLSELRALLIPLLAEPATGQAVTEQAATGQAATGQAATGQAGGYAAGVQEPGDEPAEPDAAQLEQHYDEPGYPIPSGEPEDDQADGCEPGQAGPGAPAGYGLPAVLPARSGGLAAMESVLAGAELLMVGCGEEEAW